MPPLLSALLLFAEPAEAPTYRRDIRPLLSAHCLICHAEKNRADADTSGGLVLDSLPKLLKEKDGKLIRPGKSGDSLLLQVLLRKEAEKRMPKDGEPLTKEEIDLVRRWIDGGAKEGEADAAKVEQTKARPRREQPLAIGLVQQLPPGSVRAGVGGPFSFQLRAPRLDPIVALAFSPNGDLLLAGSFGRIAVWDLREAKLRSTIAVPGYVHDLRFSPKGDRLAVAGGLPGEAGWIRLYSAPDFELTKELVGHADVVASVSFHTTEPQLVSASLDKTIRLWDLESGKPIRDFLGHSDGVTAVAFAADGKAIFSVGKDRTVRKWPTAGGKAEFTLSGHREEALAVAVAGDLLLSGGAERGLSIWNPRTGERIRLQAGAGAAASLAVGKNGSLAASAGPDNAVQLWNLPGGTQLRAIPAPGGQMSVALTADGARVAAGGADGLVRLWDTRTGRPLGLCCSLGEPGWLINTLEGWFAASASLDLSARQGGQTLTADELKEKLQRPELVKQSLAGQPAPPPQPQRRRDRP